MAAGAKYCYLVFLGRREALGSQQARMIGGSVLLPGRKVFIPQGHFETDPHCDAV